MHRALSVSEILQEIFAHLSKISRSRLSAIARTCKTFYEPAMDLLWRDIYGIEPLLGCVTRLHPLMEKGGRGIMYLQSQGIDPLSEHEARQFLHHAPRVRSLHMADDRHFHLLTVLPVETCIFPRLLDLFWTQRTSIRHLQPFWSTTLRRCILPVLHPDLKSIAIHCLVLEDLEFKTTAQLTADELSLLSKTVRSCKRLKHLECPALDPAAWNHLSNLHTLVTLRNYGPYHVPLDGSQLNFAPFLNVTSLFFSVEMAASIITVMKHSEFPSLKRFELHTVVLPWAEAEELSHALPQCKSCKTLQHLNIFSRSTLAQENSSNSSTVIRQFLCFRQLRTLHLDLDSPIYLTMTFFRKPCRVGRISAL